MILIFHWKVAAHSFIVEGLQSRNLVVHHLDPKTNKRIMKNNDWWRIIHFIFFLSHSPLNIYVYSDMYLFPLSCPTAKSNFNWKHCALNYGGRVFYKKKKKKKCCSIVAVWVIPPHDELQNTVNVTGWVMSVIMWEAISLVHSSRSVDRRKNFAWQNKWI